MTVRIGIAGIQGRMGREIAAIAASTPGIAVIGGLGRGQDRDPGAGTRSTVFAHVSELLTAVDVLVDFTNPEASVAHAAACAAAGAPLVCGTTGLDADQLADLRMAGNRIAVFYAANMSPGVNAALAVLPILVNALAGYDIEIVEAHHRDKTDAPSGTALALAQAAADASGDALEDRARYGRGAASRRHANEIGMHAIRAGGNPGEHAVILASDGEEIRLSHRAFSRAAYAQGALRAARLIVDQPPGWYDPATLSGFL